MSRNRTQVIPFSKDRGKGEGYVFTCQDMYLFACPFSQTHLQRHNANNPSTVNSHGIRFVLTLRKGLALCNK